MLCEIMDLMTSVEGIKGIDVISPQLDRGSESASGHRRNYWVELKISCSRAHSAMLNYSGEQP